MPSGAVAIRFKPLRTVLETAATELLGARVARGAGCTNCEIRVLLGFVDCTGKIQH